MIRKDIYITDHDLRRLRKLMSDPATQSETMGLDVRELALELDRGIVVAPKDVPENVITMNSRVLLRDRESGKEMTCWLVFPDKVHAVKNAVSILSPLGAAMIGNKVGDTFSWESSGSTREMEVVDILYQPERVGNFIL